MRESLSAELVWRTLNWASSSLPASGVPEHVRLRGAAEWRMGSAAGVPICPESLVPVHQTTAAFAQGRVGGRLDSQISSVYITALGAGGRKT